MEYKYVVAWGRMKNIGYYFICVRCKHAREDHAPLNALYRDKFGEWITMADVDDPAIVRKLDQLAKEGLK